MKPLKAAILITISLITSGFMAQDIGKHRWKNRIIIVKTKDANNLAFLKQMHEFKDEKNGLLDRKLVLYKIVGKRFSFTNFKTDYTEFQRISTIRDNPIYKLDSDFKILLIGLDGGIKLDQPEVLSLKKLFDTIDAMPMRQNELRNRN